MKPFDENKEEADTGGADPAKQTARRVLAAAARVGLVLVALLAAAVLAAWALLQSDAVRGRLLDMALSKASAQISGRISADGIRGNLLTGLCLKNLAVEGEDGTILSAEALDVGYWLPAFFGGRWRIRSLSLEGVHLALSRAPDGIWNWQRLTAKADGPERGGRGLKIPQVTIGRLKVTDAVVTVSGAGAQNAPPLRIDHFDLAARISTGRRLALNLQDLSFGAHPPEMALEEARGRLVFDVPGRTLSAEHLFLRTRESELTLAGRVDFSKAAPAGDLTVESRGVQLAEISRIAGTKSLLPGVVAGRIRLSGSFSDLSYEADLGLSRARLSARGKVFGLPSENPVVHLAGSVNRLDPAALALASNPAPAGDINADLTARIAFSGPLPAGTATFRLRPSRLAGVEARSGIVRAEMTGDLLRLEAEKLTTPFGRFAGKGTVSGLDRADVPLKVDAEIRADAVDPGRLTGKKRFSGSLSAALKAEGEIRTGTGGPWPAAVRGQVSGSLAPSEMAGLRIAGADFSLRWNGRRLALSAVTVKAAEASAAVSGWIDPADRRLNLALSADARDIGKVCAALLPLLPELRKAEPLAGPFSVAARVIGPWDRPRVAAHLDLRNLTVAGQKVNKASGEVRWTGGIEDYRIETRFAADGIQIFGRSLARAEGLGTVTPKRIQAGFELDTQDPEPLHVAVNGEAADWSGPVRHVALDTFGIAGRDFSVRNDGRIRLTIRPDQLEIKRLALVSGAAKLQAVGRLAPGRAEGVKVAVASLPLSRLARFFPASISAEGIAEGDLTVTGTLDAPKIDAAVQVKEGRFGSVSFSEMTFSGRIAGTAAAPTAAVRATVSDGVFRVSDARGARIDFSALTANGGFENGRVSVHAQLTEKERVVARLDAALPARFSLNPVAFAPEQSGLAARIVSDGLRISTLPIPQRLGIDADGRLKLDIRASGAIRSPALSGSMAVQDGRLSLARYGLSYEKASARLKLESGRLTVEKIALSGDSEGKVSLAGEIDLNGMRPVRFDLKVAGDNMLVPYRRTLTARVRPNLSLTGPASAPTLSGDLTILESRLNLDRLSDQGPAEIQVVGESPTNGGEVVLDAGQGQGASLLTPLSADVAVTLPKNSWMRGQGLNAEIGGQIRLRKKAGMPFVLTGDLSAIRGFYVFQGKRFTLEEGTVTFVGLEDPNPNLNIRAASKIRDVEIFVQISGTARDIRLTLDSEPPMDQADIVSYVMFGRSAEEMNTGDAISAEKAAVKMTGALTAAQLNEIFGDAFVLDTFYIDPGEGTSDGGSISMGKYVTPDVFVNYRQSFDLKQLHQLEVSYQVSPSLDLQTVIGDEKGYGIDLFWKLDY